MAPRTRVHDGYGDAVVGFAVLPDLDLVAAQGVVVGVAGVVQAHGSGGERGDVVGVLVLVSAGTETDARRVEGSVAFVDGRGLRCEGEEGEEGPGEQGGSARHGW